MNRINTLKQTVPLPSCQFCERTAAYDIKTRFGPWAYVCQTHFDGYGVGLGLGLGQRLEEEPPKPLASRTTCRACCYGDHEMQLADGQTCDCPCHGNVRSEHLRLDRPRRSKTQDAIFILMMVFLLAICIRIIAQ